MKSAAEAAAMKSAAKAACIRAGRVESRDRKQCGRYQCQILHRTTQRFM
ncbi:hypothetical protein MKK84_32345 [Methylobacterium sp. E-065]|nr:hypothetical protein [Methylobacterium sp. E-065]MCJ2022043.1 hypothetical protein [Methylobacterium sp. E-065]